MDEDKLIEIIQGMQKRSDHMQMTLWLISLGIAVLIFGSALRFQSHPIAGFDLIYMAFGFIFIVTGLLVFFRRARKGTI